MFRQSVRFRFYSTLHELVRKNRPQDIVSLLRKPLSIIDVNAPDERGELPLVIAVDRYLKGETTTEIPTLLWEWGGCYLKKDNQGQSAFWLLTATHARQNDIVRPDFCLLYDAFEQCINGCAGSNTCPTCSKRVKYKSEQERKLSPETKALIAHDVLWSNSSTTEISMKFKVSERAVIKLRTEAKNALVNEIQTNMNEFFKKQ